MKSWIATGVTGLLALALTPSLASGDPWKDESGKRWRQRNWRYRELPPGIYFRYERPRYWQVPPHYPPPWYRYDDDDDWLEDYKDWLKDRREREREAYKEWREHLKELRERERERFKRWRDRWDDDDDDD